MSRVSGRSLLIGLGLVFCGIPLRAYESQPLPSPKVSPDRKNVSIKDEIVIADFEGQDYGDWKVTGTAFGFGPAQGTLPGQMDVSGYAGHGLVNSFSGGDASTGTLTSPEFKIQRRYLNFLIGGGNHPGETCMNLLRDGKVVRTATGPNSAPGGTEKLDWRTWDVSNLIGKTVRIEIVDRATGGWGHINVDQITQSRDRAGATIVTTPLYQETYRPQFHFTAQTGWLNDPNGLVYYAGEYHLFFQHNPFGTEWGHMTWGHAVSRDLVHWQQRPNALTPDESGTIFSGSAVVDWENTSGLQAGSEKTLAALYTAAGNTSPESKGKPFTQHLVYSNDRGRTWIKYAGNPILPHLAAENRDPKVTWYAPTRKWIMALYLDGDRYALFSSPDLKAWTKLQEFSMPDCSECPDFFEIPVESEASQGGSSPYAARRWVFTAANGRYFVGAFDGQKFTPEAGPLQPDYGANYYAVQTYSDIPHSDGRRIQIAWMQGGRYPEMPFNQQMSFPCVLTLRQTSEGLRLYRWPVKEIRALHSDAHTFQNQTVEGNSNLLHNLRGDLWDIEAEFELESASEFGLRVNGQDVQFSTKDNTLHCLGRAAPLTAENGRVRLRILADRTSLEVFGNDGRVSLTSCYVPDQKAGGMEIYANGGTVKVISLQAHKLRSAWPAASAKSVAEIP